MDVDLGVRLGLFVTAAGLGFRHGVDWDHIAAITDITASQETPRRALGLATLYALGHGAVVFVLGVVAILGGELLPEGVDHAMERVVGVTLLVLGGYVFYALGRYGRDFRMRSRWMLLFSGVRRAWQWATRRRARVAVPVGAGVGAPAARDDRPNDAPFMQYTERAAVGIGMLHGVGAETPTQVLVFLAAAGAGGRGVGVLVLVAFLAGLLGSNSLIALTATFGFLRADRRFDVYAAVAVLTGACSVALGVLFLFGRGSAVPAIFGG